MASLINRSDTCFDFLSRFSWTTPLVKRQILAEKTSVRVGGEALIFAVCHNLSEIKTILDAARSFSVPLFLMGRGTNLLVPDEGFEGIVFKLGGDYRTIKTEGDKTLVAGAAATDSQLANFAKKSGLSGVEFLSTIPGSVGGAVYMNAGAHGHQIQDVVQSIETIDLEGRIKTYGPQDMGFGYRRSNLMNTHEIVLRAEFVLNPSKIDEISRLEAEFKAFRKKTQPIGKRTWGSVFKNPPNDSAGRLIEQCGLKGKVFGKVKISEVHANFIENTGGAKFEDLRKTIDFVREMVFNTFGIELETEGVILGQPHSTNNLKITK